MSTPESHIEGPIPPANTSAEVNIHLGYLRRDILNLTAQTSKDLGDIKSQISDLDDHYISEAEFGPIRDSVKQNAEDIRRLIEWKDTFNGKMIGFGAAISIITAAVSFFLNNFIK